MMQLESPGAVNGHATHAVTVADVIREYLDQARARVAAGLLQAASLDKLRLYCGSFSADFGAQPVTSCRRGDLKRWLTKHPEYKSAFTKSDACGAVVTCFRWAEEDGLISTCPYHRPRDLPAQQPRAPIRREEVEMILMHARTAGYRKTRVRFRMAVWFLWETGCRTCELYRIAWEHYDPERGLFELASKTTGKTGRNRLIVLTARAARLIRFLRRWDKRTTGTVFTNGQGRPWTKDTFSKLFRKQARGAGIRAGISAYCLRHGFCCEALEAGAGERQLADYMGHSTTRYISYYGRGVKTKVDYLRDAAEMRHRRK
jgi:integrase